MVLQQGIQTTQCFSSVVHLGTFESNRKNCIYVIYLSESKMFNHYKKIIINKIHLHSFTLIQKCSSVPPPPQSRITVMSGCIFQGTFSSKKLRHLESFFFNLSQMGMVILSYLSESEIHRKISKWR